PSFPGVPGVAEGLEIYDSTQASFSHCRNGLEVGAYLRHRRGSGRQSEASSCEHGSVPVLTGRPLPVLAIEDDRPFLEPVVDLATDLGEGGELQVSMGIDETGCDDAPVVTFLCLREFGPKSATGPNLDHPTALDRHGAAVDRRAGDRHHHVGTDELNGHQSALPPPNPRTNARWATRTTTKLGANATSAAAA